MLDACWGIHSVLNQDADEKINKGELLNSAFRRVGFKDFLLTLITGRLGRLKMPEEQRLASSGVGFWVSCGWKEICFIPLIVISAEPPTQHKSV